MAKSTKGAEKPPANGLKRLEERFAQEPVAQGFPAYLRENFDRFQRLIVGIGRRADKWQVIADWAFEEDLTGKKRLKPDAVRRAYERVRSEKLPSRQKRGSGEGKPPRSATASSHPSVTIIQPDEPAEMPATKRDAMDSLAASLDAGREWRPKKSK